MPSTAMKIKTGEKEKKATGSLERGLKILDVLRTATGPMPLKQIAVEIGCDPSTTLRLLRTLIGAEYALREPGSKLYLPAPSVLFPLSLYHPLNGFRQDAYTEISRMREETGLSVAVVVFLRQTRLVVDMVYGSERLSPYYDTHLKRPVHSSATGKILLAATPRVQWVDMLGDGPYEAFTEHTLTTAAQIEADLELFRTAGYTTAIDESVTGLSATAAPIRDRNGHIVGCIGVFGQTTGLAKAEKSPEIGERAIKAASLLEQTSTALHNLTDLLGVRGRK